MKKELKELKELSLFFARLLNNAADVLADGKVTVFEVLTQAVPLTTTLKPAFEGVDRIRAEFNEASEEDLASLYAEIAAEISLANPKAEKIAEKAVKLALDGADLVYAIMA
jgi:hypothetical protein